MVNVENFIKRLENLLEYYDLSASAFADKIGVQRSSISHLLSGRNKPSLDFVLKVVGIFPEVNLYWLLNGKGSFPESNSANVTNLPPSPKPNLTTKPELSLFPTEKGDSKKEIDKIIIFYKDGTFDAYDN